jgi:hypothetical protein
MLALLCIAEPADRNASVIGAVWPRVSGDAELNPVPLEY